MEQHSWLQADQEVHGPQNGRGAYLESDTKPGVWRTGARRCAEPSQVREKRGARKPKARTARDGSKKADIIRLLERAKGATLAELMTATGWQAHSVRGFISGTLGKRLKMKINSFRTEKGDRAYRELSGSMSSFNPTGSFTSTSPFSGVG